MGEEIKLKKPKNWKAYVVIGIIVLLIPAIYFTFFFYYTCNDLACFQAHQEKCAKTKFINDEPETTWKYVIEGKKGNACEIKVESLMIKKGTADRIKLQGKTMTCLLPLESKISPESDLRRCTGELKEEMQNFIIQSLHKYIIENLGQIDEELDKLL